MKTNPNIKRILVILGGQVSDIGKSWLLSAIGSSLESSIAFKIDPMLNTSIENVRVEKLKESIIQQPVATQLDNQTISRDLEIYKRAGLQTAPNYNYIGGSVLLEFLQKAGEEKPSKKLTFADVSSFLEEKISYEIQTCPKTRNVLIELGGTINSPESIYLPGLLRLLEDRYNIPIEICLLTYITYIIEDGCKELKTQYIRGSVADTRSMWGYNPKYLFIRRNLVPEEFSEDILKKECEKALYEIQIPKRFFLHIPNFKSFEEFKQYFLENNIIKL